MGQSPLASIETPKIIQQIAPTAIRWPDSRLTPMASATKPMPQPMAAILAQMLASAGACSSSLACCASGL